MAQKIQGIHVGYIVDGSPPQNNYRVRVVNLPTTIEAVRLSGNSSAPGGNRPTTTYMAGEKVLLWFPPDWPPAYILATVPIQTALEAGGEDVTPKTIRHDLYPPYHGYKLYSGENHYTGPPEHSTPGQWGSTAPSGVQIWHDFMKAVFRAGQQAGIEAHIIDGLLKVFGMNIDIMSGGALEQRITDTGEYSELKLTVPTLWRAKAGSFNYDRATGDPIAQFVDLAGYQGDLSLRAVQLQPPSAIGGQYGYGATIADGAMVFREKISIDGDYELESSKSMFFGKLTPGAPIVLPDHPANVTPSWPAGFAGTTAGSMGDYVTGGAGYYDMMPAHSAVDLRAMKTTIVPDDTPVGHATISGPWMSMIAKEEQAYRKGERAQTLTNSHLLEAGAAPSFEKDDHWYDLTGPDHRGQVRLIPISFWSFWKLCDDGTIVLEVGDSKFSIGPNGIAVYGTKVDVIGNESVAIGADNVDLSAYADLQLAAQNSVGFWAGQQVIAESMLRGKLDAYREDAWATMDLEVLRWNSGTSTWDVIGSAAGVSGGYHKIDVGDLSGDPSTAPTIVRIYEGGYTDEYFEADVISGGGSHIAPVPAASDDTLGVNTEGTEAAYTDTWDIADDRTKGLKLYFDFRVAYFDAGDQILYAYVRYAQFDQYGHLVGVSAETRITIDVPAVCG